MIRIEGHWETVDTLDDVVRVIREYYNEELADITNNLIDSLIDAFNERIEEIALYEDDEDWYDD